MNINNNHLFTENQASTQITGGFNKAEDLLTHEEIKCVSGGFRKVTLPNGSVVYKNGPVPVGIEDKRSKTSHPL